MAADPDHDVAELGRVLQLSSPPGRIEGFDISNISGTFAVASMVSFKNGRPDRANYRRFKMKTVTGQDDFACIAETVRRRYARVLKESAAKPSAMNAGSEPDALPEPTLLQQIDADAQPPVAPTSHDTGPTANSPLPNPNSQLPVPNLHFPDLILIDGGKGQLNAACGELAKLGLGHLAVIGLAKEYEEIYRPGESAPLRLSHDSGALKLLQRVRDESHRFANTYNAQLRLKRISESILDEFPGIGQQRKAALLKKFGSVHRLRVATVEQIAAVPGFGGKAAAELKIFLEARTVSPEGQVTPSQPTPTPEPQPEEASQGE
jgi:excinuclease ABC subunit C